MHCQLYNVVCNGQEAVAITSMPIFANGMGLGNGCHRLSCLLCTGRVPQHTVNNDRIYRALTENDSTAWLWSSGIPIIAWFGKLQWQMLLLPPYPSSICPEVLLLRLQKFIKWINMKAWPLISLSSHWHLCPWASLALACFSSFYNWAVLFLNLLEASGKEDFFSNIYLSNIYLWQYSASILLLNLCHSLPRYENSYASTQTLLPLGFYSHKTFGN